MHPAVLLGLIGFVVAPAIAVATFVRNRLVHADERITMPPQDRDQG